jgi:hypothetical protein
MLPQYSARDQSMGIPSSSLQCGISQGTDLFLSLQNYLGITVKHYE